MNIFREVNGSSAIKHPVSVIGGGKELPKRIFSIDILRALVMFFMIFVNDVSRATNIPDWIGHMGPNEDGLGFADTIFPLFLFIVGLSLPFALIKRMKRGDSFFKIASYISTRSIALLVMGFLHSNLEHYNSAAILPKPVWQLLITVSFFLIWMDYSAGFDKMKKYLLKGTGMILLLVMAILYKGGEPTSDVVSFLFKEGAPTMPIVGLKLHWWGILGIIGWSYLICAVIYVLSKGKLKVLIGLLVLFLLINVGVHTGVFTYSIPLIGDASSVALTMAGVVSSLLYKQLTGKGKDELLWWLFAATGVCMLILGFLIRPYTGGISKTHSTPAFVAICIGIGILVFELMIYLIDLKGKQDWFKIIRPAGTSTLTSYLIPYILHSVVSLTGFYYYSFFIHGAGGIMRSLFIAFFVIWIAGLLEKRKVRLQL